MKEYFIYYLVILMLVSAALFIAPTTHAIIQDGCDVDLNHDAVTDFPACTSINTGDLGFQIPSLGDILTFIIRAFFVIAGLAALLYLLLGALAWITSGGDKEAITAAQQKIQAAVIGMILIVAVLAIIWTLEQVVFNRRICLGLSCPLTLPGLVKVSEGRFCCACVDKSSGKLVDVIDAFRHQCAENGTAILTE